MFTLTQGMNLLTKYLNSPLKLPPTHLNPGLVPIRPILKSPWCCVEEHDGYQGVQHQRQHQGDQVEQRHVGEEHPDVHCRCSGVSEVTFWDLSNTNTITRLISLVSKPI